MAIRKIVKIDEEKCDGCGLCVPACAEGAIQMIDGKAKVVSETYCDGLGACLGECPQGAITIIEREAPDYDEKAVAEHLKRLGKKANEANSKKESVLAMPEGFQPAHKARHSHAEGGCPGAAMRQFDQASAAQPMPMAGAGVARPSQLSHWPVQLKLVPPQAPFLKNADLLICADCVPFTIPDFHSRFLAGRALVVGCPKLDDLQYYYQKLKDIFAQAQPSQITVVKMEVPCCNGIAEVALKARNEVAPDITVELHTIGIRGGAVCERIPAGSAA